MAKRSAWRTPLVALAGALLALLLLFRRDVADMASIWWNSSTYEHCLVILPIIGWLTWQAVPWLRHMTPRPWALPLLWIAAGAFGWLVGEAAGVAVCRQLGLVMMVQGMVAVLLGREATALILFPLFYLVFLVPAGDMLVPPLQTLTARMCMVLLGLVHVPAHLDGVFITTPAGWFKVAEACSGAKFLIAMIALGVLVAHLGFRGWWRRAAFLALCVVVPVLANGLRAFATIWVAQYRGADAASGFDHVVYGWFFFAGVIAAILALSWRFFDRPGDAPPADPDWVEAQAAKQRRSLPLPVALAAALSIAALAPAWSATITARGAGAVPAALHLPAVPGWRPVADPAAVRWAPRFEGADRLILGHYRDAAGNVVDVAFALYASQGQDRTIVGYGHGAVDPLSPWSWAATLPSPPDRLVERIEAGGASPRVVTSFYRIDGAITGSAAQVKLATLRLRLLGGDQHAEALLVSAEQARGGRAAVDRFLAALGLVGPAMQRIAAGG